MARFPGTFQQRRRAGRRGSPRKIGSQAFAFQGERAAAAKVGRVVGTGHVEAGRHEVDHVADVGRELSGLADHGGPADDERRSDAAFVGR